MRAPKYPMFPATLGNIRPERDVSVSELTRAQKEILANTSATVPVTGQYYDLIRAGQQVQTSAPAALTDAYVRGVRNKAGGVKSFAAAGYNYPSGQMVIGAALAGFGFQPPAPNKTVMVRSQEQKSRACTDLLRQYKDTAARYRAAVAAYSAALAKGTASLQTESIRRERDSLAAALGKIKYGLDQLGCSVALPGLAGAGSFMSPSEARKQQMEQLLGLGALGRAGWECKRTGGDCECDKEGADTFCSVNEAVREGIAALLDEWDRLSVKDKFYLIAKVQEKADSGSTVEISGTKYKTVCVLRVMGDNAAKIPKSCIDAVTNLSNDAFKDVAGQSGLSMIAKGVGIIAVRALKAVAKCLPAAIPILIQSGMKCSVEAAAPADSGSGSGSSGGGMTLIRPTLRVPGFSLPGTGVGTGTGTGTAQPPAPKGEGLSTGAMVGIGAAVVAVLGIGGYFLLRKKASAA